jgi:predicted nuclease of predicted toxin-antitoxin system
VSVSKFLLDVNMSPETQAFLRETFGFDVIRSSPPTLPDEDIVKLAKQEQRVVITQDLDFGEIYYLRERGRLGVIVLRLTDQTVESVNRVLATFFRAQAEAIPLSTSLVVIDEHHFRVVLAER